MVNAQEWLDKNYALSKRNEITYLDTNYKNLTGELVLVGFTNLTRLYCSNNNLTNLVVSNNTILTILNCSNCQLTNLQLTNNPQLSWLFCHNNNLTNLDFLTQLTPANLTWLDINNNKLTGDLVVYQKILSQFTKLKTLVLDNNPFTGSLIFLTNLTKLKYLDIRNVQIDSGLEYLSTSLKTIDCEKTQLEQYLNEKYKIIDYNIDRYLGHYYQGWRKDHPELIKIGQLETMLTNLILSNVQNETSEIFFQGFNVFIFEIQSKITALKNQNKKYYQTKIEIPPKIN